MNVGFRTKDGTVVRFKATGKRKRKGPKRKMSAAQKSGLALGRVIGFTKLPKLRVATCETKQKLLRRAQDALREGQSRRGSDLYRRARKAYDKLEADANRCARRGR